MNGYIIISNICFLVLRYNSCMGPLLLILLTTISICAGLSPPIIDVSPLFRAGQDTVDVTRQIDEAFVNYGVFIAIGHSITEADYAASISSGYHLFDLPIEAKDNVSIDKVGGIGRGYLSFGKESGLTSSFFEPKEGYSYGQGRDIDKGPKHPLDRLNVWPDGFGREHVDNLTGLFEAKVHIASAILAALDLIDAGVSRSYTAAAQGGDAISIMRLFHYFPSSATPSTAQREVICSSPHTDWGFLTLIAHDGVKGLQFQYNGEWNDVEVVPNGIVINGGDFLRFVSNGRYRSPIHRVVCPPEGKHRLSYVLFFYPNHSEELLLPSKSCGANSCIDGTGDDALEYNTLFEASDAGDSLVSFGDYIMKKWQGVLV